MIEFLDGPVCCSAVAASREIPLPGFSSTAQIVVVAVLFPDTETERSKQRENALQRQQQPDGSLLADAHPEKQAAPSPPSSCCLLLQSSVRPFFLPVLFPHTHTHKQQLQQQQLQFQIRHRQQSAVLSSTITQQQAACCTSFSLNDCQVNQRQSLSI